MIHKDLTIAILRSRNYDILCVVSTILFDKKCHSEHETFVRVWQCDYFASTNRQIALSMIQFPKAVYSENSLKFSILVKMLHNIFRHNTDYVIYAAKQTWSSEPYPKIHKICFCTHIVGKQTTTSYKKSAHGSLDW